MNHTPAPAICGPSGHAQDIEVRTLDSYQFSDVDIIKIDVEGMEVPLLQGAEQTIRRNRPWILIEGNKSPGRYGQIQTRHLTSITQLGHDSSLQEVAGSDISFYELESTGIQAAVMDWKAGS
jgi:hypothetical protein